MPGFIHIYNKTGQSVQEQVAIYRSWDHELNDLWHRMEGVRADGPSRARTQGLDVLRELISFKSFEDMESYWFGKARSERALEWPSAIMSAMNFYPEKTTLVLEATFEPNVTPNWAVADVFCFLVRWSSTLPADGQSEQRARLSGLLLHLLNNSRPRHYQLQQWVLGSILSVCEPSAAAEIYEALRRYHHPLHFNTKLKIAGLLVKDGQYKRVVLKILKEILQDGRVDANDPRCAALATELLKLPEGWEQGRAAPVEIRLLAETFESIVDLGLSPNVITYTALMRALCLTDQLDAAWKVYEVMRNQGTAPDAHVFSVLLNGAKLAGRLDSAIRVLEDAPADALREPYIWTDLIHTVHLAAKKEAKFKRLTPPYAIPAFHSMLQVYAKFFKLGPLQSLIPLDLAHRLVEGDWDNNTEHWDYWDFKAKLALPIDRLPASPPDKLVEPSIETLGFMLLGYINNFSTAQPALSFYSHFRNLLRNRDPIAIGLVSRNTLPYDVVLNSITQSPGMLRVAVDIVKVMLKDAQDSAAALGNPSEPTPIPTTTPADPEHAFGLENTADLGSMVGRESTQHEAASTPTNPHSPKRFTNPAFYHPRPSVYTWTILLRAFMQERHVRNAAHILSIMAGHGVRPDLVTYNTLVFAYGRAQAHSGVRGTLEQLEAAGYYPDRYTVRGVASLHDNEDVLAKLEERAEDRDAARLREVRRASAAFSAGK
ncbi:hypothetical protein C8A00DRAFT_12758, partial [Chaetomidium leptoderma]